MARDSYPQINKYLSGVDAAANELEAPPEIFGPVYRYLRRKGFQHFTYHAGEDFHHLIGGLRAMYEAVEFLDLHRGDRIGHGTAAGIDPRIWLDHLGEEFPISQGEWLDDLLFAIHMIERQPSCTLVDKLALLRSGPGRLDVFAPFICSTTWRTLRRCSLGRRKNGTNVHRLGRTTRPLNCWIITTALTAGNGTIKRL